MIDGVNRRSPDEESEQSFEKLSRNITPPVAARRRLPAADVFSKLSFEEFANAS
jgi:hypothetical protein